MKKHPDRKLPLAKLLGPRSGFKPGDWIQLETWEFGPLLQPGDRIAVEPAAELFIYEPALIELRNPSRFVFCFLHGFHRDYPGYVVLPNYHCNKEDTEMVHCSECYCRLAVTRMMRAWRITAVLQTRSPAPLRPDSIFRTMFWTTNGFGPKDKPSVPVWRDQERAAS